MVIVVNEQKYLLADAMATSEEHKENPEDLEELTPADKQVAKKIE